MLATARRRSRRAACRRARATRGQDQRPRRPAPARAGRDRSRTGPTARRRSCCERLARIAVEVDEASASGNAARGTATRSAFFGVFSSSRTPVRRRAAGGRRGRAARRRSARCSARDDLGPASAAVSRFESQPRAAGCSSAIPSMTAWLSPPTVHTSGARASVSNSERGARARRRDDEQRPLERGPAAGAAAARGRAPRGSPPGGAASCRAISTASVPLDERDRARRAARAAPRPRREPRVGGPARVGVAVAGPRGAPVARERRARTAASARPASPSATASRIVGDQRAAAPTGVITTGTLTRSVSRRDRRRRSRTGDRLAAPLAGDQIPERARADGVGDEVDALVARSG